MISDEYNIVSGESSLIKWVVATLPKEGEQECADLYFVKAIENGAIFVVVDGLGHGSKAVQVSRKAINCFKSGGDKPLISLLKNCHERLKGSRGAVLSIARLNIVNHELEWLSVGNVEGVLMSRNDKKNEFKQLVLRSGVIGYKLPTLKVSAEKASAGDILFFTTDGVMSEYIESVDYNRPIKETVKYAAENYFKDSDDSLILAARLRNSPG